MEKGGYIKIYRKSEEDELYFSEPFSKWQAWCDLIQLALYHDKVFFVRGVRINGKRGCVYTSRRELAERWKWSRGKVDRFIYYLAKVDKVEPHNTTVKGCIVICNYDKYQGTDFKTESQVKAQIMPDKKNINNTSPSTSECTRENEEKEFILSMKHSQDWLEAVCLKFHLSRSDIIKKIDEFNLDQICRDHKHNSLSDVKRHFNDWLVIKINVEKKKRNEKQQNTLSTKRRGTEAAVTSPEDFKTPF